MISPVQRINPINGSWWEQIGIAMCVCSFCFASGQASWGESPNDSIAWASWRGPSADGQTNLPGLPSQWSSDSIAWKTPLPGNGQSSPILWGDRIFLTSSLEEGRQRLVYCVSSTDGKLLWQQVAWSGDPEPTHEMNGWASASCATDGERVYAFFGRGGGLHCFDVDGKHLWSRDLGSFEGPWGTAASPIIVRDMVIQNCDSDAGAFLVAVDKRTGEDVWRTTRPDHRGWSTPVFIDRVREAGDREELVMNGHLGVTSYDPDTGKQLWICRCDEGRGSPTATPSNGLLYILNGLSGGGAYCVRPGGSGDVTESHRLWFQRRSGRDLSSPIVLGRTMLAMSLRSSILTGYDVETGEEKWNQRIGGQISATPIAFNDRAYFIDETGRTLVVDPDSDQKIVATNVLEGEEGELFRASITPGHQRLFIRSNRYLYCIAGRRP